MDNALVVYKTGVVHFDNYQEILGQAQELASLLEGVEVTEDTIKTSKKMIAEVRKKVDELDDARKDIKKEVLASYTDFETKVKVITSVVREAENVVRSQVKELEENERYAKKIEINELFYKRKRLYPTLDIFQLDHFLENRHLNKSLSIFKVEKEIVEWLEQRKAHLEHIQQLEHGEEILVEYVNTLDPIKAVTTVKERHTARKLVEKASGMTVFTIVAKSEMEVKYIENILNTHGIIFVK